MNKIIKNVRAWNRARKIEAQLSSLTTRELDELGIGRHGISEVAKTW